MITLINFRLGIVLAYTFALIAVDSNCAEPIGKSSPEDSAPAPVLKGKLAYVSLTNNIWQVWTIDLKSGQTHKITNSPIDKRTPTWSHNGDQIAYRTSSGKLELISVEKEDTTEIAAGLGFMVDPRLSPSGNKIAFARFELGPPDNTDIYVYSLTDKKLNKLTNTPALEYAAAWSPDERMIAYICDHGRNKSSLMVMNADGSQPTVLQESPSNDMCPSWSPDGKWIVFSSCRSGDYEIWKVRPNGQELQMLTQSPGLDTSPCYAPDGTRIAFTSNRQEKLRIWTMRPDGSEVQPLTGELISARDPAWWPQSEEGDKKGVSK